MTTTQFNLLIQYIDQRLLAHDEGKDKVEYWKEQGPHHKQAESLKEQLRQSVIDDLCSSR